MKIYGKVSHFGGPQDEGVKPDENLAFWENIAQVAKPDELFLPTQPPGTTGLARRLDPSKFYIACRWDYSIYPKSMLASGNYKAVIMAPKTGRHVLARPADWGPDEQTGRVCDVSPAVLEFLQIQTDDYVWVTFDEDEEPIMPTPLRVAISAGHGKYVTGAAGVDGLEESQETPKVMAGVATELRRRGVEVVEFWDQTSKTQQQNLDAIVSWHNKQTRDLDVSIHFNSSEDGQGHGVEVLYVTQEELAARIADEVSEGTDLTDRSAKYRDNLAFLNGTTKPAVLVECLFINNVNDAHIYKADFADLCSSIAAGISGIEAPVEPPDPGPSPEPEPRVVVAMTVPPGVDLAIVINGVPLNWKDEDD